MSFLTNRGWTLTAMANARSTGDRRNDGLRRERYRNTKSPTCRTGRGVKLVWLLGARMIHIHDGIPFLPTSETRRLQRCTLIVYTCAHDEDNPHD